MGEMASLWGYAEHHDMDQLGQKLLYTTLELEKLKSEAMEEMRKNKDYVNQLIHLLKCAIQERDEARNQLGKLINKTMSITNSENFPSIPHFQADSPLLKPAKANSSITESNSLSETYNYQSPVESLFDAVSSPELSNMNFNLVAPDSNASFQSSSFSPVGVPKIDQGSLIIDNLAKGRVLPRNGMFLQAVLETGPLLQTLLVAGPLPRWRNPPRLQPFHIPPVSIKGGGDEVLAQKPAANLGQLASRSQMISHSYANFGNLVSGNCVSNGSLISPSALSNTACFRLAKRQRFS